MVNESSTQPHVFRPPAMMFERLLALPYAIEISDDEDASFLPSTSTHQYQVTTSCRASILLLLKVCHSESPWREPDYTYFPSPHVLSHCVGLYFNHFHPILPILRTSAYQEGQATHSVRPADAGPKAVLSRTTPMLNRDDAYYTLRTLTIAAIGATYAEDRLKPLAGYLMELARRIGSYLVCFLCLCLCLLAQCRRSLLTSSFGVATWRSSVHLLHSIYTESFVDRCRWLRRWIERAVFDV